VPRRHYRRVGTERRELRGEDREVREDGGDHEIVVVPGEASMEGARESGGEVGRLGDRTPIVGVEVGRRCDHTKGDPSWPISSKLSQKWRP
jgi:hypothetical protein